MLFIHDNLQASLSFKLKNEYLKQKKTSLSNYDNYGIGI